MGDTIFGSSPNFGELIEKKIGDDIFCQIPLTLYGNDEGTFPNSIHESSFYNDLNIIDENTNNLALRLGNIINTYNVFHHFYPYFDEVNIDWSKEFETALKRSFNDQTSDEHLITLQKFTAPLRDGHIEITGGHKLYNFMPSIHWQWIESKLVITNVFDKNLNIKIGDVVTKINSLNTKDYFQETYSRISAATKGYLNHRAQIASLLGEKGSKLKLEVKGKTIDLNRDMEYQKYNFTEIEVQKNTYKELDGNIMYLNLDVIDMEGINKLLPQLNKAKGIICDFRGYSYSVYDFISHLTNQDINTKSTTRISKTICPDQENSIGYKGMGAGKIMAKQPYLGDNKVVFIIDGRAISSAEGIMSDIKNHKLATIIGQPTAGTNGMINPFQLLGNYTIYYTGAKIVNPDGSKFHGIGVLPDIYVKKTIEGIKAGKDEFLEKAIELINK